MPECTGMIIPDACCGLRLDQALVRMMPGTGRRGVRRLLDICLVLVDGDRLAAGGRVRAGQRVSMEARQDSLLVPRLRTYPGLDVRVVERNDHFAALIKPAGMHSQRQSRTAGPSLETELSGLLPGQRAVLLNRLDFPVSGLILAALTEQAVRDYAVWQDQGAVFKHYLAMVSGQVTEAMEIRLALDTAKRRKVRVMSKEEPDAFRWTRVFPVTYNVSSDESLVRVDIHKGRRHHIRAHLAAAGHPVKLDPLYGAGPDLGWIYLHHCRVVMPGFAACNYPDWPDRQMDDLAMDTQFRSLSMESTPVHGPSFNSPVPWQNPPR